jgi:hypothetical protein
MQLEIDSHVIEFCGCMEICQGGPEACDLLIDGMPIEGRFDPSPLHFEGMILVPKRKISFLKSGYVLVAIDPNTGRTKVLSKIFGYMRLVRIEDRIVEFASTAWGDETAHYRLP